MSRSDAVLESILDSWDRNNQILVNLLRAVPAVGLTARVMMDSPSVAEMFAHIHYVRLVFLAEDVPERALPLPAEEWLSEGNVERMAVQLEISARAVREAVDDCMRASREMKVHYDNPLLFVQHMIWHEGYHHGQIKLALKAAGHPFDDEQIGPLTWDLWMDKTQEKPIVLH